MKRGPSSLGLCALAVFLAARPARSADQPQWGEAWTRNMVSAEQGLPVAADPATGSNIAWTAGLGTDSYATPVVGGGHVYIGGNNGTPRDPRHTGDRGVLFCFDERDGRFLWQLAIPKRSEDIYLDWPNAGICSPATVDGGRVFILSNRGQVLALDPDGLADGNDGPFLDEGRLYSPPEEAPGEPGPADADVLWMRDLVTDCGIYTHDSTHASIMALDGRLYLNSCNGVDNTHRKIRRPDAPALIVLDRETGAWLARDAERIGPRTFHCTWSSPALARPGGRDLVVLGGADGVLYGIAPLASPPPGAPPARLDTVWRFDCDPTGPKEEVHRFVGNRKESPSVIKAMPVVAGGSVFVVAGGDRWWGKPLAWLKRVDPGRTGDVTAAAEQWSYAIDTHSMSTPAVAGGLVYLADCKGRIHCVDAETGRAVWVHEAGGEIWGSTLVAGGRVYVGTRRGELHVLAAGRTEKVLAVTKFDGPITGTPVAADGVLYVATAKTLYALRAGAVTPPAARGP